MPIGFFGRRAKSMVGLDIGTSRVKLVELVARGASVELARAAVELTPVDVIRDGKVVQPEQVAAVIKKALAAGHFRPGEVVAAIAGQGVVVRHVQFPKMPEEELREALKWEGQKHIPFPVEDAVVDFEVIHGVVRLVFDDVYHSEGAVEQVSQFGQWFKMLGLSECFYISGQDDLVKAFKLSLFWYDE